MIYSMTGYAGVQKEWPQGTLSLELRAVNHRFLDVTLRMPEECRPLESALREKIAARVSRGKLECRINLNLQDGGAGGALQLNTALVDDLLRVARELQARMPESDELRMGEVLRWPGVLVSNALPVEQIQAAVLALMDQALEEFLASRAREGEKLAAMLIDRADQRAAQVAIVKPLIPQLIADYDAKLKQRLIEALGSADDERVRQEVVLFAQKVDVAEEMDRLGAHLSELRRILKGKGPIGKRLDFLMQELNRESNTLGSKSVAVETSKVSMELKILIEQMREQIQNIE